MKPPQTGYLKRALKADGKGGLYLDCACGEQVTITDRPRGTTLTLTYECGKCGTIYSSRGWILGKRG